MRKRAIRRLWSKEKVRVRRGATPCVHFLKLGRLVNLTLRAPRHFDVWNPAYRGGTVDFLERLRRHSRKKGVALILDFSETELVFATGAVLLVAEIDRALATRLAVVQARRCSQLVTDEILQHLGIYAKLGIRCSQEPQHESVIHWRVASGVYAEGKAGGSILESYEGRLAEGLTRGLYDGVVEAMTNTVQHAYADDVRGGRELRHSIGRRWWIISEERDGMLTMCICDLGVGIPRSLPRSKTFSSRSVRDFKRNARLDNSDGSAIAVAVRLGRTRTNLKERGRGLADIVAAVNLSDRGSVLISSNHGNFSAEKGSERVNNSPHSIHGTMVHWKVPIKEDEHDQ